MWVWTLVFFKNLYILISENSWLPKTTSHNFPDNVAWYDLHMQTRHHSVLVLGVLRAFSILIANFPGFVICFDVVLRVRHFRDVATITDAAYIHNIWYLKIDFSKIVLWCHRIQFYKKKSLYNKIRSKLPVWRNAQRIGLLIRGFLVRAPGQVFFYMPVSRYRLICRPSTVFKRPDRGVV